MAIRPQRYWYPVAVLFAVLVSVTFFNVSYTNQVDKESDRDNRQNDQKWCTLLITMDDAYKANPPQTATGRKLATDISSLRTGLGC